MPQDERLDNETLEKTLLRMPKRSYTAQSTEGQSPYKLIEEQSMGNPLRLRRLAYELRQISWRKGLDVEDRLRALVDGYPCRGGEIVKLIEDALWFRFGKVHLRSLQCGMGKSTAISYVIRDVIEYGEGRGILITTDSIERLKSYLTPKFDQELADFIKEHESSITLIESANKTEALQRMRSTPVLLMTTQRYFGMSVAEINDILYGSGIRRDAVIIDEKPIIKTVETVSRTDVNKVASALSDGLRSYDNHEEKRWMIRFWEDIRSEFMRAAQAYEDAHIGATPFFAKYSGMPGLTEKECEEFLATLEMRRNQIRRFDPDCLGRCERILDVALKGGLFYGDSGQYYRSCFYTVVNRWDRMSSAYASIVVLDGTGDIHPDYDGQEPLARMTEGLPTRKLSNLALHFVNVDASKQRLTTEDRRGQHKQAILRNLGSMGIDKEHTPLFTYKDCEQWFRYRGFKRTGHFGDIKGRNSYADATSIVQVGMNLYARQDYLTLWLADHPDKREDILGLPQEEMNQALEALRKSNDVIDLQNRILLSELEQNMFRCAIRSREFTRQATFYVLCDTNMHRQLIDMARKRYGRLDVEVVVETETPDEVQSAKREKQKAKNPEKRTAFQRFMEWYRMCPPGKELTARQLQMEANLSASDLKNLGKRRSTGEYYDAVAGPLLAAMRVGWNRYRKPIGEAVEGATD